MEPRPRPAPPTLPSLAPALEGDAGTLFKGGEVQIPHLRVCLLRPKRFVVKGCGWERRLGTSGCAPRATEAMRAAAPVPAGSSGQDGGYTETLTF